MPTNENCTQITISNEDQLSRRNDFPEKVRPQRINSPFGKKTFEILKIISSTRSGPGVNEPAQRLFYRYYKFEHQFKKRQSIITYGRYLYNSSNFMGFQQLCTLPFGTHLILSLRSHLKKARMPAVLTNSLEETQTCGWFLQILTPSLSGRRPHGPEA
jgi:hypothetical protein